MREKFISYATSIQKGLEPRVAGFIGNLEIGKRYADETVFRRVIEFNNPTSSVQSTTLTLTVTNGEKIINENL